MNNIDNYGFILLRHVNSIKTNLYWNHNLKLLLYFYPNFKIIIIDDNSDYKYVKKFDDNIVINNFFINDLSSNTNIYLIQSEYKQRGELLPYYYYLKYNFFKNAIIIHDSVFIHKKINFNLLNNIRVIPLWHFNPDRENINNTLNIVSCLYNNTTLINNLSISNILQLPKDKWFGCFGSQCIINYEFLKYLQEKYKIMNMLNKINCRSDRCCLERILGCIFFSEYKKLSSQKSLLGDIRSYQKWETTFDEYLNSINNGLIENKPLIKVWTGR